MSKQNTIKTIFIGTPDFAVPSLEKLIKDSKFEVLLVITQPDKNVGRKQILTSPPIKELAKKYNIPVSQPEKISNLKYQISNLNPDIAVVVAYKQIIPKDILSIPKYGFINVHGSLLPKYRGSSCIQSAILNGDKESGITIMKMDSGLDTGPILAQNKIKLASNETAGSLYDKLKELGANFLLPAIVGYIEERLMPREQDSSKSSYAKELKKSDGEIDWKKSALEIERFIRAMNPWPMAYAELRIKNKKLRIRIIEVEKDIIQINKHKSGEFFVHDDKLAVQCGKNALIIKTIQPEGKKPITGKEFIQGYLK